MKKVLVLVLTLSLGALLISGCQTNSSSTTPTIPEATAAASIANVAGMSTAVDNAVRSAANILSVGTPQIMGTYTAPSFEASGWWESTISASSAAYSYDYDLNFRIFYNPGSGVTEAINQTMLDAVISTNLDKMYVYTVMTMTYSGASFTLKMGGAQTEADCLKYTNIQTSPTIDGPISITGSGTDANGDAFSYTTTLTYSSATMVNGYPSGTVNFSIAVTSGGNSGTMSGSVVFNGTNQATVNFSGGGSTTVTLYAY